MLAENLENLVKKERLEGLQEGLQEGRQEGLQEGLQEGALKARCETARNLLSFGVLSDQQISDATGLKLEEIAKLRLEDKH